jgi:hypothetical protein
VPDPGDADQILSFWQEALAVEVGALDDMGARIMPGMLSPGREDRTAAWLVPAGWAG